MWASGRKILNKLFQRTLGQISRKDFLIGIDLGSTSVKFVQFYKDKEGLCLRKADLKETGPPEDPSSRKQKIAAALKEWLRGMDLRHSAFAVTFNGPEAGARIVTAPPMPRQELGEALKLEVKKYFAFAAESAVLDFESCGETMEKGVLKQRVFVAAAEGKAVDEILALLKNAMIQPDSLVPVPCALQKLGECFGPKDETIRCLVEIGECHTEFVILRGSRLAFTHKIPVTGRDFTQAMTAVLGSDLGKTGLSLEEAETIKREVGIPPENEGGMIRATISSAQVLAMLRRPLEQLVEEIDRCLSYYQEETDGGKVDSLFLFGRGAFLKGLCQSLSAGLGIEVKIGNPLEIFGIKSSGLKADQDFSPFAPALGAALSCGKGVNLLPPEIKYKTRHTFKRTLIRSGMAAGILLLAFLYIGMTIQARNFQKRIEAARQEIASIQADMPEIRMRIAAHNRRAAEPYWEDIFKEISHLVPPGVVLTELRMTDGKIGLKGTLASETKEAVLSDFISQLKQRAFKNVKLVTASEQPGKRSSEFELECRLD